MIKISVIIPVYNNSLYLEKVVRSVLMQTFKEFELILINDGSTDNSGEICNKLMENDGRIRVINNKNQGVAATRNLGISLSKGEFIYFMDSDDYLEVDLLEAMYNAMIENSSEVAVCGYNVITYVNKSDSIKDIIITDKINYYTCTEVRNNFMNLINKKLAYSVWNKLYRKDYLENNKIKFLEFNFAEDAIFNINVFSNAKNVTVLNNAYYNYIRNSNVSLSTKYNKYRFRNINILYGNLIDMYKKWGLIEKYKKELYSMYFNDIVSSFINLLDIKCSLTHNEKVKEIDKVISSENILSILPEIEPKTRKQKILYNLVKRKKARTIYLIVCIWNQIKLIFASTFKMKSLYRW